MGGKQLGFLHWQVTTTKKQAKWEKLVSEMEAVMPGRAPIALIEPGSRKHAQHGGQRIVRQAASHPGSAQCVRHDDAARHDHQCHLDSGAPLYQEQRGEAGSRDEPNQEGQPVLFRHEDLRSRGKGLGHLSLPGKMTSLQSDHSKHLGAQSCLRIQV